MEDGSVDEDIAYVSDIAKRILSKQLFTDENDEVFESLREGLGRAEQKVPTLASYEPDPKTAPQVGNILQEIKRLQPTADPGAPVRRQPANRPDPDSSP
jgi:hypothetical protein